MSQHKRRVVTSPYTPNMEQPGQRHMRVSRGLVGAILTLVLPPVGMAILWRTGVFRTRGRVFLSAVGTIVMAVWCVLLIPSKEMRYDRPTPAIPAQVTAAPEDNTASALSNLDELLAQRQAERDAAAGITPEPTSANSPEFLAEQQQILQTIVYAVYGNSAKYYHAGPVCNTQSNRRALTVQEALYAGMGACPDCNPPSPSGVLEVR